MAWCLIESKTSEGDGLAVGQLDARFGLGTGPAIGQGENPSLSVAWFDRKT